MSINEPKDKKINHHAKATLPTNTNGKMRSDACLQGSTSTPSELVLHFKLEDDIQVVGGDLDYTPLRSMLNSYDRLCAARFFTEQLKLHCDDDNHDQALWYFRAAISELQSFGEVFPSGLPDALVPVWKRSNIKFALDTHELLSILTQVRHLSLHTAKLAGIVKDFKVIHLPGGEKTHTCLFIDTIQENYNSRRHPIAADKLKWFNRQVQILPAHWILIEACFIAALARINFLRMYEHLINRP